MAVLEVFLLSHHVLACLAPTLPFCATVLFHAPVLAPSRAPSACALARGDLSHARALFPCAAHGDLSLDPGTNIYAHGLLNIYTQIKGLGMFELLFCFLATHSFILL